MVTLFFSVMFFEKISVNDQENQFDRLLACFFLSQESRGWSCNNVFNPWCL